MRTFATPAELIGLENDPLGTSSWLLIDQARIDAFADATGDRQWIHVDPARAASGPYGTTIAHGYLTLSLLPALSAQIYEVHGAKMTVNYGLNRVRFTGVVPVESNVRTSVTVLGVDVRPTGIQLSLEHTMHREGTERPVLIAQQLRLLVP